MNSTERLDRRLRGQPVDRAPNFDIVMAFACHFIGEPLSRYYLDYRVLAQANLAVQEEFHLDILQAISDPYREAADLGLQVEFPDDGLPLRKSPLLVEPSDIGRLKAIEPSRSRRMSDRVEGVRLMRARAGEGVPVMGWVEGALAELNVLRGDTCLMLDLYDRPDFVHGCLEICTEVAIAFARAQIAAGASIIGLGDAIASQISPAMYQEFALPYEQRIFRAVREAGALARLHICGNTSRILPLLCCSGADIVDLDWMVDMRRAVELFGQGGPAVCGNFDPVRIMLRGSPEEVGEAVRESLEAGGRRSLNMPGCEIPDGTPHANLRAQTAALRQAGAK
jgi:MtaA/CmuA family methyltransferase